MSAPFSVIPYPELRLINVTKMSNSKFVWFFGDDDKILPLGLKTILDYILNFNADDQLNAIILSRSILDADTGYIYDEEYDKFLRETKLFTPKKSILKYLNYGDLTVISRLIIRKNFLNNDSWANTYNFALQPQLSCLIEAISQGNHLWICENLILYRYLSSNKNWSASGVIANAIEFPSYNILASSLNIPTEYLRNTYSKKGALYSYLKIKFFNQEYGTKLTEIAEKVLSLAFLNFKYIKNFIDLIIENKLISNIFKSLILKIRPQFLIESQAVEQHLLDVEN